MKKIKQKGKKIHITGLQNLLKLSENIVSAVEKSKLYIDVIIYKTPIIKLVAL